MNTTHNEQNSPDASDDGIQTDRRPLGYWLRVVDGLLAAEFADAFAADGATRRDWMLLNLLSGDIELPGFAERVARKGKRLRGLVERGWVDEQTDGTWTLTDEGRAAKERLAAAVDGLRARVAGAVSPEDFATTMASLEAIARELGWDEKSPRGFGGPFGRGRRGFGPGFAFRPGYGPGFGHGHGHGHDGDPDAEAHGHGHGERFAYGPWARGGFAYAAHGRHGFPRPGGHGFGPGHHGEHPHGGHDGNHTHGDAERAFERGFAAGFAAAEHRADA